MSSRLFRFKDKQDQDQIDWKLLTFFALYTCKQKKSTSIPRIATHIAREATKDELMRADLFLSAIKVVCMMASTDLIKAVDESNYMKDLYSTSQHKSLESAVDRLC